MQRAANGRVLVVCDACVLINFLFAGRLDLLGGNLDYRFVLTEHAVAEVTDPALAQRLQEAIAGGEFEITEVANPEEIVDFAELRQFLGAGEAAAIAVAAHRNCSVATDERGRTRLEIARRLGPRRLLTTPAILLRSIQAGRLTVEEADAIKTILETHRFKMSFGSFAELLA